MKAGSCEEARLAAQLGQSARLIQRQSARRQALDDDKAEAGRKLFVVASKLQVQFARGQV